MIIVKLRVRPVSSCQLPNTSTLPLLQLKSHHNYVYTSSKYIGVSCTRGIVLYIYTTIDTLTLLVIHRRTPFKTNPSQVTLGGLTSTLIVSLFKTVVALTWDKTENGLKSEEHVMHAIASTTRMTYLQHTLLPGTSSGDAPKGTQQTTHRTQHGSGQYSGFPDDMRMRP